MQYLKVSTLICSITPIVSCHSCAISCCTYILSYICDSLNAVGCALQWTKFIASFVESPKNEHKKRQLTDLPQLNSKYLKVKYNWNLSKVNIIQQMSG